MLIVEEQEKGRLYAVESAAPDVYALCRLADFVTRELLERKYKTASDSSAPRPERRAIQEKTDGAPWWRRAAVDWQGGAQSSNTESTPLMTSTMEVVELAEETQSVKAPAHVAVDLPSIVGEDKADDEIHEICAQDLLQDLMRQYLDALYLSRTSPAYFVKGPLSRARAAFSGNAGSEKHISNLTAFLQEMILSATLMDKKYKDGLSSIIDEIPEQLGANDGNEHKSRKKRKWKLKRGRNGLFALEGDYVVDWWRGGDEDPLDFSCVETAAAAVRRRVPYLRSRETKLQIVLILETLALEAAQKYTLGNPPADQESQNPDILTLETQLQPQAGPKRGKSSVDIHALLETLLDRLTIWHSLESHSPTKEAGLNGDITKAEASDELKNFCIEVVIPFYMSRLPKGATMVNKKLGGPSPPTPVKHTSSSRRPGEPASRHAPGEKKARKPLHRVSTETLAHTTKPPAGLHRSATDSQLQHSSAAIKRESSLSLSLHSIPAAKPDRRRPSTHALASLTRREIDLAAVSAATEEKLRRKAQQEEKVREAIAGMKKPNRGLALMETAARVDARFAEATAASRKPASQPSSRAPREHAPVDGVHVAATPKVGRTVAATPRKHNLGPAFGRGPVDSGAAAVPSSAARLPPPPETFGGSTPAVPQTGHRARPGRGGAEESPSSGAARFKAGGVAAPKPAVADSPVGRGMRAQDGTPSKEARARARWAPPETPVARAAKRDAAGGVRGGVSGTSIPRTPAASPTAARIADRGGPAAEGKSIYDALGWNDENYEELA